MSHALYRLGRFSAGRPWIVISVWFGALMLVIGASAGFGRELTDSFEVPGLDSQQALDLLAQAQSDQAGLTAQIVAAPQGDAGFFSSESALADLVTVQRAITDLHDVIGVTDVVGAIRQGPETAVASGAVSPDGRVALFQLQYPDVEQLGAEHLDAFEEAVATLDTTLSLQVEGRGDLFFAFGETESGASEIVGLIAAMIILLVAFGSLIAMGLPIAMAIFGLALGVSSMALVTYVVEIPSFAPQMATMIGLGVGIDYALFLVTRHREFLHSGLSVVESAARAVATSGLAVVFAGGTVVIAILGLSVAGIPFMTAAGIATSIIVGVMVVASVTLLPAFLGLVGHRINRTLFRRSSTGASTGDVSHRWSRWGSHVSRHAWVYAIGVTTLLVGLAAPVLNLHIGWPDDGTLPEDRTERRAYDLISDGFGPGVNGPLIIAMDISQGASDVEALHSAVSEDPGLVAVLPPAIDWSAGVATMVAIPATSPQSVDTVETVERIRNNIFPAVLGNGAATAHVGGQTAIFADMGEKVTDRLPWFIAVVVLLSFVLLTAVFRSVLVPLKAAVLNLLSIGAAYGVLVMVFQWGWGAELLGVEGSLPVVAFIPLFMFAVLFGLSMDYEVFLLSRVREEYLRTGNNDDAVIRGLAGTARVITSAALIMISVFMAAVANPDPLTKMVGLGLATAIFVDATIVRIVLVPATMKLMGKANWWLPSWLDRLLPTIDIDGAGEVDTSRSTEELIAA